MNLIRILVADDQALMCDGLKTILELEEDMKVVGTAGNGLQAYEMTGLLKPDVVLMDIRMPLMDGVESTRMIKRDYPNVMVIMLTTFNDEEYIIQALSFGANGFLLKDILGDSLIQAVREGVKGNLMIPSSVAAKLAAKLSSLTTGLGKQEESSPTEFSQREKEISKLIVRGYSNKEIASELCISEGTVKNYISNIYSKIGVNDRIKAVMYIKKKMAME